ncbi:MAG: MTH938/NDUFAF3 family protein [Candidatus Pacebacteria bacterium]|nr:MTH938/NDUFAF3 family protein [Candidatus Paceibacterota bacterium]
MIEEYNFGEILIDGKKYDRDIEVRWTGEILPWQKKESHLIDLEDVKRAIDQNPGTIVIGTGESGQVKVTEEAEKEIKQKGIKLIIDLTEQAIRTFNILKEDSLEEEGVQEKVIGLFHLTC